MGDVSQLQRKWRWQVNTGSTAVKVWTTVIGLENFAFVPTPVIQEDDDYEADGWQGDEVTALKWAISATVKQKGDVDTIQPNAAHERLRQASLFLLYPDQKVVEMRVYDRFGGPEAFELTGYVNRTPSGGGMTDLEKVQYEIGPHSSSPQAVQITNPILAPAPVPIVASVSPASGPDAGGTAVFVTGANFDGVTGVTFDGDPATEVQLVPGTNGTIVAATTPAGLVGAVDVVVTTAAGSGTGTDAYTYTA